MLTKPTARFGAALRDLARVVALLAAILAVADGFRWGNRRYVSTMFDRSGHADMSAELLVKAQEALASGLGLLVVAVVAAAFEWRLRVMRQPTE